jgi:O-acetyl-ADP-ribose deacetylase (regulator of RNase III)
MPAPVRTKVELKCPSCGQAGVAMIVSAGERKTASVIHGFIVKIAADNRLEIVCDRCRITVYEAE